MRMSMATDSYPSMHAPWGHWPSYHMQGSYMQPHWQNGVSNNASCMYGGPPDYRSEKPPLTQLQELASVFPPAVKSEVPTAEPEPSGFLSDAHFLAKERYGDRECDSGYSHDQKHTFPSDVHYAERECDSGYSHDPKPYSDHPPKCDSAFLPDMPAPRECDSGFGPTFPGKEEPELFNECDGGRTPVTRDVLAGDSDSGCADVIGKWEEEPPNALPGFQQAFGSTEIGRFSRNDFFTNPSPPQAIEPEPPRKQTRKPRSPRVKQVKRSESPKVRVSSVPMPEAPMCNSRVCGPPYQNAMPQHYDHPPQQRYCSEYSHPYVRNYPPSYHPQAPPSCDSPYFRPFPFPMECGQSWHEPRWQHYQQPYQQQQQPWTSANVYPYMRLDY